MKYIIKILFILVVNVLSAQIQYLDSLFSVVNTTTYNFETSENETLQFDYYRAENVQDQIPLIIYVHGGGFSGGTRDNQDIIDFATKLAQRGYAFASVSYKLTMKGIGFGCNVNAIQKIAAINAASFDVNLATKYILENNKNFRIDKNKIILMGSSAGAETVLNMAYVYNNNKTLPSEFNYAGVVSLAGALTTLNKISAKTAIPTLLFHGTSDRLVPYGIAPHHYCKSTEKGYLILYGSAPIAVRLKGLGTSYYLYTINGGSHDWASIPMTRCFNDILDFLYYDIVNSNNLRQTERVIYME